MDQLKEIFSTQKMLNDYIIEKRHLDGISDDEWIQKYMLAMMSEMAEVLDETNFKWWKNKKEIDSAALKEELVDVLHFYVSMCLRAGMTAEELHDLYMEKNKENVRRQQGLSDKPGYKAE